MSIHKLPSGGYMEADRLIEAEKDIAAIKATVDPLLTTLNENTKAVTELTYQVRSLVDIYQSQEKNLLNVNVRLKKLEEHHIAGRAGRSVSKYAIRALIGVMVANIVGGVWYVMSNLGGT